MRTPVLGTLGLCLLLALLGVVPARADAPEPIESIDAWMDDFMTCFRSDDGDCLHQVFARHWYAMPDQAPVPNDPDAFFAFLEERRAIDAPYEFERFQYADLDERMFSATYFVGAMISADEITVFALTVGAWIVDGELFLFRVRVMDDPRNPRIAIDVVDPPS